MTMLHLAGCRTRPLGSYLKALGIHRLVAAQVDLSARGAWNGDSFSLDTSLTADELIEFFLSHYIPTPLVSPWNGGSGFDPKDQQAGIGAIEASVDSRFADYRDAIAAARTMVADPWWSPADKKQKELQIRRCRNELPDAAVTWLDAAVVIAADRAVFPPLFGTGGNDGRLDFSNNYMQRLSELFLIPPRRNAPDPEQLLRGALFGSDSGPLVDASVGQYDPNAAESDVSASNGRGGRLANPWDFILLLEGGLLFASGAARRLGSTSSSKAAMPFTVMSSPVGYASSAENEEARGEIWAPLWSRPATSGEIARLIGEGRAQWNERSATNGIDFAKAVATLGVDRGLDRFVRHGLVQRNGLSFFAVPLDEVEVGHNPQIDVLRQLDGWLRNIRRPLPAAATSALHRVEALEYRSATAAGSFRPSGLQDVLEAVAELEAAVGRSTKRSDLTVPVGGKRHPGLIAADWVPRLDEHSVEFRLAVSLASARDRFPSGKLDVLSRTVSSLALLLRPVVLSERGDLDWSPDPARVAGLGHLPLPNVLAAALERHAIDRASSNATDSTPSESAGPTFSVGTFEIGSTVDLADLELLLEGRVDLDRLGAIFRGLVLIGWRRTTSESPVETWRPPDSNGQRAWPRVTPSLAALLPFFHGRPFPAKSRDGQPIDVQLRPGRNWPRLLASDNDALVDDVLSNALDRLRIAGLQPAARKIRRRRSESGPILATAALCHLTNSSAAHLLYLTCPENDPTEHSSIPEVAR